MADTLSRINRAETPEELRKIMKDAGLSEPGTFYRTSPSHTSSSYMEHSAITISTGVLEALRQENRYLRKKLKELEGKDKPKPKVKVEKFVPPLKTQDTIQ